jgi:hypothetical protein
LRSKKAIRSTVFLVLGESDIRLRRVWPRRSEARANLFWKQLRLLDCREVFQGGNQPDCVLV